MWRQEGGVKNCQILRSSFMDVPLMSICLYLVYKLNQFFSLDSKVIAVGSHDNITYLYSCEDLKSEYKAVGKCSGHSSFITHLDFSDDGKVSYEWAIDG